MLHGDSSTLHFECRIKELGGLLQHREQVLAIVESEADEIAAKFGSPRCTVMSAEASSSMSVEDIIPNSQSLVVFSRKGYIKRIPADTFAVQHRGGRGDQPSSTERNYQVARHGVSEAHGDLSFPFPLLY